MKKTFLYLIIASATLTSCKTSAEIEKMYRADYYNYSCPQLYQKYISVKRRYEEERATRLTVNTARAVADALNPNGVRYNNYHASHKEHDYEIQMKAIENLAIDKHCEGVRFN